MGTPEDLRQVEQEARSLEQQITEQGNFTPAYDVIEATLPVVEQSEGPQGVAALLQGAQSYAVGSVEATSDMLNLDALKSNGAAFWRVYSASLRDQICDENADLHGLVKRGIQGGAGALVPVLAAAIAIPAVALPIIAAVAAILATTGLESFCDVSSGEGSSTDEGGDGQT